MSSELTRRKFIGTVGLGAAAAAARPLEAGPATVPRRRNVLIIIADDLGYSDLGCYGSEISTPAIDRLAAQGTRFTQFYGCSVCCPSRAALLTGLYPHQAGHAWFVNNGADTRPPGPYEGYLSNHCVTLPEVLRDSGYRTYMSGKWHLGESRPHWPVDRGFDRYFGLISGAANYFDFDKAGHPGEIRKMAVDGEAYHPPKEGFYMTDAIGERAVRFLGEHGRRADPFFLYVAFTAPHYPEQAPADDIARNRGRYRAGWDVLRRRRYERMREMGVLDTATSLSPRDRRAPAWEKADSPDVEDLKMAIYAAQVEVMDRNVGRIMEKLREIGAENDTLVFFLADHGACANTRVSNREPRFNLPPHLGGPDSFAAYGRPWANLSSTPWRNFKGSLGEGGISIPMIAAAPGLTVRPGGFCRELGHQFDFMPTLLELTGAAYPRQFHGHKVDPCEGRSFASQMRGESGPERGEVFWEYCGQRVVRDGPWKLIGDEVSPWKLHEMSRDRTESTDLSADEPDRVSKMAGAWQAWSRRCGVLPWAQVAPTLRNLGPPPPLSGDFTG